jgi:hypothetical protein
VYGESGWVASALVRRRLVSVLAACLVLPALAGCGDRTPSDEEQVREVLTTFAKATERRDYRTMCDEVFAPKLLSGLQEIGLPCEVALRNSLGEVRNPRLTVGKVTVRGKAATADIRTAAEGQEPSSDTIRLDKIKEKWRVSDLDAAPRAG